MIFLQKFKVKSQKIENMCADFFTKLVEDCALRYLMVSTIKGE